MPPQRNAISTIPVALVIILIVGAAVVSGLILSGKFPSTATSSFTTSVNSSSLITSLSTSFLSSTSTQSTNDSQNSGTTSLFTTSSVVTATAPKASSSSSSSSTSARTESQTDQATSETNTASTTSSTSISYSQSTETVATIPVGKGPSWDLYDPITNEIYVSNGVSNSISVIDGTTNRIISTIVGANYTPSGIGLSPLNNEIFVSLYGSNKVMIINGSTNQRITALDIGGPLGMAYDPDSGYMYVAANDVVAIVSTQANSIVGTVNLPSQSHGGYQAVGLAYDAQNSNLYVSLMGEGNANQPSMVVINTISENIVAQMKFEQGRASGVTFDPTNGLIYVADASGGEGNTVIAISPSTNLALDNITVGTQPQQIAYDSSDNSLLVTCVVSSTISVIDGSTNKVSETMNSAGSPTGITYDSANGYIYVTNANANEVSIISP